MSAVEQFAWVVCLLKESCRLKRSWGAKNILDSLNKHCTTKSQHNRHRYSNLDYLAMINAEEIRNVSSKRRESVSAEWLLAELSSGDECRCKSQQFSLCCKQISHQEREVALFRYTKSEIENN